LRYSCLQGLKDIVNMRALIELQN